MTLPAFEYVAPKTLSEAIGALAMHGADAKVLAGGQSLIPLLAMRLARPSTVVDISRLVELRYIRIVDGHMRIGALTRHKDLERSPDVRSRFPVLAAAAGLIGHSHVRNRGTIGGSLAHADPAAELPAVALALDASVVASGPDGAREIPASDLLVGPLTTSLDPREILTEVRIPLPPEAHGWAFREFAQRSGDFALVSACALITLRGADRETMDRVRIVVGGAASIPWRCTAAERAIIGRTPESETMREAVALAADEVDVQDDAHVPAAYRRRLIRVLVRDALDEAAARLRVMRAVAP